MTLCTAVSLSLMLSWALESNQTDDFRSHQGPQQQAQAKDKSVDSHFSIFVFHITCHKSFPLDVFCRISISPEYYFQCLIYFSRCKAMMIFRLFFNLKWCSGFWISFSSNHIFPAEASEVNFPFDDYVWPYFLSPSWTMRVSYGSVVSIVPILLDDDSAQSAISLGFPQIWLLSCPFRLCQHANFITNRTVLLTHDVHNYKARRSITRS